MKPSLTTRICNLLLAAFLPLALLPARAVAQQPRAGGAPSDGVIMGRVIGIGGEPLAQVFVLIQSRNTGARLMRTTTTDNEGNFIFEKLAPSTYSVTATAPGHVIELEPSLAAAYGSTYRPGDFVTLRVVKGGVITGRVTDMDGEPIVALRVSALRIRSIDDDSPLSSGGFSSASTDDRGIYRIYGLASGVYVVSAGGGGMTPFSPFDADSPTFYPSGTRDTATEISVRAGQEIEGIDIRYRFERGYRVSGTLEAGAAPLDALAAVSIALEHAATGVTLNWAGVAQRDVERSYQFNGVADGDYDVRAFVRLSDGETHNTEARRITVRGADLTGIRLKLTPPASVAGTLVVEPPTEALRSTELCKEIKPRLFAQEVLIAARRDEPSRTEAARTAQQFTRSASSPDDSGAFLLRNLEAGRYRLEIRPLDESLYVSSIRLPPVAAQPAQAPSKGTPQRTQAAPRANAQTPSSIADHSRLPITLKSGQRLTGVGVRVSFGAAFVAGNIHASTENEETYISTTSARLYLVPTETERAEDISRYSEARVSADGSFTFRNVAPGNYRLLLRQMNPPSVEAAQPIFWSAEGRAGLRREAETAGRPVELHPCQRLTNVNIEPRTAAAAPPANP